MPDFERDERGIVKTDIHGKKIAKVLNGKIVWMPNENILSFEPTILILSEEITRSHL